GLALILTRPVLRVVRPVGGVVDDYQDIGGIAPACAADEDVDVLRRGRQRNDQCEGHRQQKRPFSFEVFGLHDDPSRRYGHEVAISFVPTRLAIPCFTTAVGPWLAAEVPFGARFCATARISQTLLAQLESLHAPP